MKKLILILCFSVFAASCSDVPSNTEQKLSLQEKLAILDGIAVPDSNDIKVIRIKTLLEFLSTSYGEPKDTIAEWTSRAQGVLHDKGVQETNLNILEEMNKAGKIENTPYRSAITLYAMLRARGY